MAIGAVASRIFAAAPGIARTLWKGAKVAPNIMFSEKAAKAFVRGANSTTKAKGGSLLGALWKGAKEGGKAARASVKGNIFKTMLHDLKTLPAVVKAETAAGKAAAKAAGKSGLWGGTKGVFKGLGKRMPLIGNLMLLAFEIPNIVKATKEKGIGAGIAETAKAGIRLTAASIASVAMAGIIPPWGSIAGFMIGDWLASKVVGKSYSEKKAIEEQQREEILAQTQGQAQGQPQIQNGAYPYQMTTNPTQNPAMTNPFDNFNYNPSNYSNDILTKGINLNAYV